MIQQQIGKLVEGEGYRDAIHVAVAPLVANEKLHAGDHVGVRDDGKTATREKPIGIVDPFLAQPVHPGQRFLVFLYPNTIGDMHHHWAHPAFDRVGDKKAEARKAIGVIAARLGRDFGTFDALMAHVESCIDGGEHYVERDSEWLRNVWYEVEGEFWEHFETLTGKKKPEEFTPIFCCTC